MYSYIQDYYDEHKRVFGIEAALLSKNDPQKLISRTYPFLVPETAYELYGLVPKIVFPSGATIHNDQLHVWYGGADTVCAKLSIRLGDLLRALDPAGPSRTLIRAHENPILAPSKNAFESRAVFNAATLELEGSIHILYRAMSADNTSTIGYARTEDGITISERLDTPCYAPRADFEMKKGKQDGNSGCEDPRIVQIGDTLFMTYTAYDGVQSPRGAVTSISVADFLAKKFDAWTMPYLLTPDNVDDKDLSLLPATVKDGQYLLYHRIERRVCVDILPELFSGKRVSRCIEIMGPRPGMWDGAKVGIAAPPFKVPEGWVLIYHAVSDHGTYRLGAVLLDENGTTLLARTADPIFEPEAPYELVGEVPDVVFSCGAVIHVRLQAASVRIPQTGTSGFDSDGAATDGDDVGANELPRRCVEVQVRSARTVRHVVERNAASHGQDR